MTDTGNDDAALFPGSVGERLRAAREARQLSLSEVAARTRIPLRHLEAIETGDYGALPSATYAVGFAKAYARAVGVDEVAVGREVRARDDQAVNRREYTAYEITDPARTPSRGLALIGAALALLLLVGSALWFGGAFDGRGGGDGGPVAMATDATVPAVAMNAAAPSAAGQVRLTAAGEVWLRVYDGGGQTLFIGTLRPGQSFDVPPAADRPMVNVGRPDELQVTVDGRPVAALGDGSHPIKDVGISAAALAARTGPALAPVVVAPDAAGTAPATGAAINIASPSSAAPAP